jgi:type I restriction enzyme M protein
LPVERLVDEGVDLELRLWNIGKQLAAHKALEDEAKALKGELRVAEKRREELVAAARAKITPQAARTQILLRFRNELFATYRAYLDADRRAVTAAIENLYQKYAVTVRHIEKQRSDAAVELENYLGKLGYV